MLASLMLKTQAQETTVDTKAPETKGAIGRDGGSRQPELVVSDI